MNAGVPTRATRPIGGGRRARISTFRRFPIRRKLAITLAIPMLALLLILVLQVHQARQRAQTIQEQAELAKAAAGVDGLQAMLQQERSHTSLELYGLEEPDAFEAGTLAEARSMTDDALAAFAATVEGRGSPVRDLYQPALDVINGDSGQGSGLNEMRQRVDRRDDTTDVTELADDLFVGYGDMIEPLSTANRAAAGNVDDLTLRRGVALVGLVTDQRDLVSYVARAMSNLGSADSPDFADNLGTVITSYGTMRANDHLISVEAKGLYEPLAEDLYASPHHQPLSEAIESTLATRQPELAAVLENTVPGDLADFSYRTFGAAVASELETKADSLASDAQRQQNTYVLFGLGALLLTGVVTWAMSRVLIGSLKSLAGQAASMWQQLPTVVRGVLETPSGEEVKVPELAPIEVSSRDEIAEVASALNDVQSSTVGLAVEQAVLRRNIADSLLGLGRRNQGLLDRQIDLITSMENGETDPDALAKLFSLDHLATRMRRNAESLLVLGGSAPPRRWSRPVPVRDVVRAALGEVEGYQRVLIRTLEPEAVAGSAAADVIHLLAELIENALTFSLPLAPVEIEGRTRPEGYQVQVIDLGRGMAPEDLARSNRRLAGVESFTVAPSRSLGHYVTGHLAARHGIGVELQPTSDRAPVREGHQGITAVIRLPQNLLATASSLREPAHLSSPEPPPSSAYARPLPPGDGPTAKGGERQLEQRGRGPSA